MANSSPLSVDVIVLLLIGAKEAGVPAEQIGEALRRARPDWDDVSDMHEWIDDISSAVTWKDPEV